MQWRERTHLEKRMVSNLYWLIDMMQTDEDKGKAIVSLHKDVFPVVLSYAQTMTESDNPVRIMLENYAKVISLFG